MKLSHPERIVTAQLLCFLDNVAEDVRTFKPRTIHSNRSTIYVIAQGIGYQGKYQVLRTYIGSFSALWYELAHGGEDGYGRHLTEQDLDFVISRDGLIREYLGRLIELGADPWTVQATTLQGWFSKKGYV